MRIEGLIWVKHDCSSNILHQGHHTVCEAKRFPLQVQACILNLLQRLHCNKLNCLKHYHLQQRTMKSFCILKKTIYKEAIAQSGRGTKSIKKLLYLRRRRWCPEPLLRICVLEQREDMSQLSNKIHATESCLVSQQLLRFKTAWHLCTSHLTSNQP